MKISSLAVCLTLWSFGSALIAQTTSTVQNDYIYGYAPVAMATTRTIMTAVPDNKTIPGFAPINQFGYATSLPSHGPSLIIRPSPDFLYTGAWLDLSNGPMILHLPKGVNHYYLMPMLDAYSNEFGAVSSVSDGDEGGDYAIVGPGWTGTLPANLVKTFVSRTNTVWVLGRTLVNGSSNLAPIVALTKQYLLIPLAEYPEFLITGEYTPPTNVAVTLPQLIGLGAPVTNALVFDLPFFFDVLAAYALQNPLDDPTTAAMVIDGLIHKDELNATVIRGAQSAIVSALQQTLQTENGWWQEPLAGNYGTNYAVRAAITEVGFGANVSSEAVYFNTSSDISGALLNSANSYVIHFAPGQTPPQNGFWSVTLYDNDGFLVANSISRYSLGSLSGLAQGSDGSYDIYVQAGQPKTDESNWLPTAAAKSAAPFGLMLRIYAPAPSVQNGAWIPPTVSRTSKPKG